MKRLITFLEKFYVIHFWISFLFCHSSKNRSLMANTQGKSRYLSLWPPVICGSASQLMWHPLSALSASQPRWLAKHNLRTLCKTFCDIWRHADVWCLDPIHQSPYGKNHVSVLLSAQNSNTQHLGQNNLADSGARKKKKDGGSKVTLNLPCTLFWHCSATQSLAASIWETQNNPLNGCMKVIYMQ